VCRKQVTSRVWRPVECGMEVEEAGGGNYQIKTQIYSSTWQY